MRYGTTETKNTYEPQTISPRIYRTNGNDDVADYFSALILVKAGYMIISSLTYLYGTRLVFLGQAPNLRLLLSKAVLSRIEFY